MGRLLTLLSPREARAFYAAGTWQGDTLYALLDRWADERPAASALRDGHARLSWSGLRDAANALAAALDGAGLAPGDRVSVWTSNRVEAVVTFLACSRNGYVYNTSLHQTYTVEETLRALEQVGSRALIAEIGHGANTAITDIFAPAAELSSLRVLYALPPRKRLNVAIPEHAAPFPTHLSSDQPAPADDPDQIGYLAFTSGTTGTPKGVMHSDNTLLANARAMVRDWHLTSDAVLLTLSQLSHHIGTVALTQSLVSGCELVLFDPSTGRKPLDWILDSGATYVMGVPTHAIDIVADARARGLDTLGKVSTFYMAGALIPGETAEALTGLGALPQNVYGMTECGSHNYPHPDDPLDIIQGSCGRACNAYEIRLFDQQDRNLEVAPGEIGEIGGRGAARMLGYFANQPATEASFNRDGWFMSGDLGRLDPAGNLQIVGRSKDIIIRGGHNIHPAKIEDLAMRHPAIAKAAAIPVPDQRLGEKVCLVATRPAGAVEVSASVILEHLSRSGLARFDMPEYFVWVDELPLGATGKILKHGLIAWLQSGRLVPEPVLRTPQPAETAA